MKYGRIQDDCNAVETMCFQDLDWTGPADLPRQQILEEEEKRVALVSAWARHYREGEIKETDTER